MKTSDTSQSDNLRPKQAAHHLNISRTTLWRLSERDPSFPKKIKPSPRLCFYSKAELDEWLESQKV